GGYAEVADTAAVIGGVAADRAVGCRQPRLAVDGEGFVVDAAAVAGRVAADSAVGCRQRGDVGDSAAVADAVAAATAEAAAEGAVGHRQRGSIIINAAAGTKNVSTAIGNRKTVNRNGFAWIDVKHATLRVAVHGQIFGAGAADGNIFVHDQFAANQRDSLP